jgi:hypothetical protein
MRVLLAALALLLAVFSQTQEQAGTLRGALRQDGLPLDGANLPDLDRKITSGAELDSPEQFVLAYYLDDGTRNLNPPLTLVRYDKKSKTWQTGFIAKAAAVWQDTEVPCLGSVLDVRSFGEGFLVETHINPSAGCALILSKTFQLEASLYGWALDSFSDGTLVYHRSQIHFATVHPAEIAVFDPRSKREFTIFPPKAPTPVRQKLTEQLSEFFKTHRDYCAKANDPCDPQMFDSALDGKIAIDDREHALAFSVSYRLLGYGQDDGKPSGPGRVVYVYRNANDEEKIEVRELLPAEIKAQFGAAPLQDLLDPEHLKVVFQK